MVKSKKQSALERIKPLVRLLHKDLGVGRQAKKNKKKNEKVTKKAAIDPIKRAANLAKHGNDCALESNVLNEMVALESKIVRAPDGALEDCLYPKGDAGRYVPIQLKTTASLQANGAYYFQQTGNGTNRNGGVREPIKYKDILLVGVVVVAEHRYWWIFKNVEATCVPVRIGCDKGSITTLARGEGLASLLTTIQTNDFGFLPLIGVCDIHITSEDTKKEHRLAYLIRQNLPGSYVRPETQNDVVDDLVAYSDDNDKDDHKQHHSRVQNKTCYIHGTKPGVYCPHIHKRAGTVNGVQTKAPYGADDNDFYVFGCICEAAVFLWRIDNATMIKQERVGNGDAKPSLYLHVPDDVQVLEEGEPTHLRVFRKDTTAWTREHFVGRFPITNAQRIALANGTYLETLI